MDKFDKKLLRKKLWEKQMRICAICKRDIPRFVEASLDHRKPKSLGGKDSPQNFRVTHKTCNQKRGNAWHGRGTAQAARSPDETA